MSEVDEQIKQTPEPVKNTAIESGLPAKQSSLKLYLVYLVVAILGYALTALFFHFVPNPLGDKTTLVSPVVVKQAVSAPVKSKLPQVAPTVVNTPKVVNKDPVTVPADTLKKTADQANDEPVAQVKTVPPPPQPPSLVLSGLFFSGKLGYALINNQIVKEGDTIEGVKVIKISARAVNLKFGESDIVLNNPK